MRSTTSPMSFGARMRLANADISLREPCPKSAQGLSEGRIATRGPERDQVLGLAVGHATKLDGGRWLRRDAVDLRQCGADVIGCDRFLVGWQDEPCGGPARGKP